MKHTLTMMAMLLCFSAFAQTLHTEAENCINNFGLVKEPTQDIGGGLELGYADPNDWADYTVNIPVSGNYFINFRIASQLASQINIISGSNVIGTINTPVTGGWQNWSTVSTTISLKAGQQTLRLLFVKNGINLNWFEIINSSSVSTSVLTSDFQNRLDSLGNVIKSLSIKVDGIKTFYFKAGSLKGSNTPADPYYFTPTTTP